MNLLLIGIALGAFCVVAYAHLKQATSNRLNFGKKVTSGHRHAGYIVSCRFNGNKKFFYVNEYGDLSREYWYDKKDAVEACREEFGKDRPKSTLFARSA